LTLYFPERSPHVALAALMQPLPEGHALAPRDARLFELSPDYDSTLAAFGTVDDVLRHTLGVSLLHDDAVLCEAATGAPTHGRIEVGVTTAEAARRRGFATAACARLIAMCEARGYATWWDCAKQNIASVRLAHRLGYQSGREYRYVWWAKR
jgi:RimJ/RimL family protein N-acetyltransferase